MTNVSVQQARIRLRALPENLQGVIFSAQTAEIIGRIGEQNHLPDEKVARIAEAAGIAILGFIHVEELAKEIQERAQIPPDLAKSVAASVENRILNSIRADLEKVYAPAAEEPAVAPAMAGKPEMQPPTIGGVPKPAPKPPAAPAKPFIDLSSLSAGIKTGPGATPPAPPVKPASMPPPAGLPTQASWKTYGTKPAAEPAKIPGTSPKPPPSPVPTTPPTTAPVLLKRNLEVEPVKPMGGIRFEPASQFQSMKGVSAPPKPARLEIGKFTPSAASGPPQPVRTSMTPPRVVHYSQWQTPSSGKATEGGPTSQVQPPKPPTLTPTPPPAGGPPGPPASTKPISPTPPPAPPAK